MPAKPKVKPKAAWLPTGMRVRMLPGNDKLMVVLEQGVRPTSGSPTGRSVSATADVERAGGKVEMDG